MKLSPKLMKSGLEVISPGRDGLNPSGDLQPALGHLDPGSPAPNGAGVFIGIAPGTDGLEPSWLVTQNPACLSEFRIAEEI